MMKMENTISMESLPPDVKSIYSEIKLWSVRTTHSILHLSEIEFKQKFHCDAENKKRNASTCMKGQDDVATQEMFYKCHNVHLYNMIRLQMLCVYVCM